MASVPYITTADIGGALSWPLVVDAMSKAHQSPAMKVTDQVLTEGDNRLLVRGAWGQGIGPGVKACTIRPGNADLNLPSVHGAMIVFDPETGAPRAMIDNEVITWWKTAADSALCARLLARGDASHLLIIGAGTVARSLIEAYPAVLPQLEKITIWNRSTDRAEKLAQQTGVLVATDLKAAIAEADIIATCTLSATPVLRGAALCPGQHIDLIGAFTAEMREADDDALRCARLFVDSRATTLDHIGELRIPLESGVIARSDILGDLYDLVQGGRGRTSDQDITICKNGGGAHLDLMVAAVILEALSL